MLQTSYYWHDYETFGTDPQRDRVCQFAGIRTDLEFKIIGEPLMLYCKTPEDYLPNPEACLITGITPQLACEKGICEAAFTQAVHEQLAQPGTCGLGYNSIRFDDEVTRNLLYRNFFDPYAREWQNGNSRWDLIDIARAAHALRPEGINWPLTDTGVTSFRLEQLTQANDISHQSAHDALSDVHATIALARLIKLKQPRLYAYLFANRQKTAVTQLLQLGSFTPLVHVSGRFSVQNNCLAVILPLCLHPINQNEVIVYDLSVESSALLELNASEIQQRLFVANADLPENCERIPLKTVHINKSPVLAPLSVIRPKDAQRLELDLAQCHKNLARIQSSPIQQLTQKLAQVFTRTYDNAPKDPDLMLYSGGFFSNKDKSSLQKIRQLPPEKLADFTANFDDDRLPEMLFRYRARNYPHTLTATEQQQWQTFCQNRLFSPESPGNATEFFEKLTHLKTELGAENPILQQLEDYLAGKQSLNHSCSGLRTN